MAYSVIKHEGEVYIKLPSVLQKSGLLTSGRGQTIFYSKQTLHEGADSMSGKSVFLNHQLENSKGNTEEPDIHNRSRIGTVYNAMFSQEKDALIGDVYLNLKRIKSIIPKIEKPILAGVALELSTGVRVTGAYDESKGYINAEHIIFDHLALLPDAKGSCSLADGCGLGVNNKREEVDNLLIQSLYKN